MTTTGRSRPFARAQSPSNGRSILGTCGSTPSNTSQSIACHLAPSGANSSKELRLIAQVYDSQTTRLWPWCERRDVRCDSGPLVVLTRAKDVELQMQAQRPTQSNPVAQHDIEAVQTMRGSRIAVACTLRAPLRNRTIGACPIPFSRITEYCQCQCLLVTQWTTWSQLPSLPTTIRAKASAVLVLSRTVEMTWRNGGSWLGVSRDNEQGSP